jgi:hypothetical protein
VRCRIATDYLWHAPSMQEIAELLGFSEAPNSGAFLRWTQRSPSSYGQR